MIIDQWISWVQCTIHFRTNPVVTCDHLIDWHGQLCWQLSLKCIVIMIFNVVQLSSNWWQFSSMFGLLRSSCSGRACFSSFHSCHFSSVAALDPAGYVAQVLERLKTRCPNNILRLIISPITVVKLSLGRCPGICNFLHPKLNVSFFLSCLICLGLSTPAAASIFGKLPPHLGHGLFWMHHRGSRQVFRGLGLFAEAAVLQLATFASWDEKNVSG